jgi:hypothetical protein
MVEVHVLFEGDGVRRFERVTGDGRPFYQIRHSDGFPQVLGDQAGDSFMAMLSHFREVEAERDRLRDVLADATEWMESRAVLDATEDCIDPRNWRERVPHWWVKAVKLVGEQGLGDKLAAGASGEGEASNA